jgi:hypothetical protein
MRRAASRTRGEEDRRGKVYVCSALETVGDGQLTMKYYKREKCDPESQNKVT